MRREKLSSWTVPEKPSGIKPIYISRVSSPTLQTSTGLSCETPATSLLCQWPRKCLGRPSGRRRGLKTWRIAFWVFSILTCRCCMGRERRHSGAYRMRSSNSQVICPSSRGMVVKLPSKLHNNRAKHLSTYSLSRLQTLQAVRALHCGLDLRQGTTRFP